MLCDTLAKYRPNIAETLRTKSLLFSGLNHQLRWRKRSRRSDGQTNLPNGVQIINLLGREYGVLAAPEMNPSGKFVDRQRDFIRLSYTEERRESLIVSNERSHSRSGRDTKELASAGGLVVCEQIRRRLILLEVGLIVQRPPRSTKRLSKGCIELGSEFKCVSEVRTWFSRLNGPYTWSNPVNEARPGWNTSHLYIKNGVRLI